MVQSAQCYPKELHKYIYRKDRKKKKEKDYQRRSILAYVNELRNDL